MAVDTATWHQAASLNRMVLANAVALLAERQQDVELYTELKPPQPLAGGDSDTGNYQHI